MAIRHAVLGAGGVGGLVGGALALVGHPVTLLARQATAGDLRADEPTQGCSRFAARGDGARQEQSVGSVA